MFRRINGASPTPPQTLLESPQISRFKQHGPTVAGTQPLDERLRSHPLSLHSPREKTAKEKIVGWYSTGPKIRTADLDIHALFTDYHPSPVFVIIDVAPTSGGHPHLRVSRENEIRDDGTQKEEKTFVHVPSSIEAFEAEEIGVEHLLRDVKDNTVSTLATQVSEKISSLDGLEKRLREKSGTWTSWWTGRCR